MNAFNKSLASMGIIMPSETVTVAASVCKPSQLTPQPASSQSGSASTASSDMAPWSFTSWAVLAALGVSAVAVIYFAMRAFDWLRHTGAGEEVSSNVVKLRSKV